jgi:O-antigen ligase
VLVFFLAAVDAVRLLPSLKQCVAFSLCFGVVMVICSHATRLDTLSLSNVSVSSLSGALIHLAFLGFLLKGKWWRAMHAYVAAAVVLGMSSATNVSLAFGAAVYLLFRRGKSRAQVALLLPLVLLLCVLAGMNFRQALFPMQSDTNITTASGRMPVWEWVLKEKIAERPVLGYGFGEGEVLARLYHTGGLRMMHMHNCLMGALANIGVLGTLPILIFYGGCFWLILKGEVEGKSLWLGAYAALMLNSLSIRSITSPLTTTWLCHMLFFLTVAVHLRIRGVDQ